MTEEQESLVPETGSVEPGNELTSEVRNWGMACHLSALIGFLIPLGSVIAPLVVWMLKRDESEFINFHGKEALNFQITVLIAFLVSALLALVLIGFLLMAVVGIGALVLTIIAAIKTSEGQHYKYPFALRLIS